MNATDQDTQQKSHPEGTIPSGNDSGFNKELEKSLRLGEQVVGFITDVTDVAGMEAALAAKSIPRLIMLWFLIKPAILLSWCSFSVMIAWFAYSASDLVGVGLFAFFLLQLLLLLVCYRLYAKHKVRMTFPYTREHLGRFMRGFNDESSNSAGNKKL
jgi:hypothetical protein